MALSFEESMNKIASQPMRMAVRTMSLSNNASISGMEDTFVLNDKYKIYENSYKDEQMSYVDDDKNITVNQAQTCVMQENNSQYIPFELNRYYDGVDLNTMTFTVHYVNAKGEEGASLPVNFYYNDSKIRFAWLLSSNATQVDGDVIFEIIAFGYNEKDEKYLWRTKPNGKITVLKSLTGNGTVNPTPDWYLDFLEELDAKVDDAIEQHDIDTESHDDIRSLVGENIVMWDNF